MDRIIESIIQIFQQKYNLEKFDTTTVKQAGKKKVKKKKTEKKNEKSNSVSLPKEHQGRSSTC